MPAPYIARVTGAARPDFDYIADRAARRLLAARDHLDVVVGIAQAAGRDVDSDPDVIRARAHVARWDRLLAERRAVAEGTR
jgi:hypothetical protein